jgi:REP element-mobilizing transposase RayT
MDAIKNVRLKDYDYRTNGYYFVTIVTEGRLRRLEGATQDLVQEQLQSPFRERGVSINFFVVMPNHLHFILVLSDSLLPLGEVVRRFKARTSLAAGRRLWQPNYYEHVIRSDRALLKIREYIQQNPDVEKMDWDTIKDRPINRATTEKRSS